jgi:CheY-like chemotaxis protein
MNILYIEDNAKDRQLVERYIHTTPHQIVSISKLDTIDLHELSPDLILLDMLIDGQSIGLDYLRQLREMEIQCPVVAITALTLPQQIAAYNKAGINVIIEKPFDINLLASVIAQHANIS